MSHAATDWAIKQRGLKPAAKIVLWHLCDRYHPDNGCFPSQETLAGDCEMSRASLNTQLAALEGAGLIARETRRHAENQRQERTRYRFAFEPDFPAKPSPESGHGPESKKPAEPSPENGESRVQNLDSNLVREPVREPERESARAGPEEPEAALGAFRDLVKAYPTGFADNLEAGERAWRGLTAEQRRDAAAKLPAFLASLGESKRRMPPALASYLADRRWLLIPAAPKAAPAPSGHAFVGAFDRAWWWLLFDWIARHGAAVGQRGTDAARFYETRVSLGFAKIGWKVAAGQVEAIEAAALGMTKAHVDGEIFAAWFDEILTTFGVRLPRPDAAGWAWVPAAHPRDWQPQEAAEHEEAE
ncbi:MAG: helix-turn-helix domain-containing protein [Bauldia sp.]|nr:helix-turn-helix domain-containing protein [Bauldia sp.]